MTATSEAGGVRDESKTAERLDVGLRLKSFIEAKGGRVEMSTMGIMCLLQEKDPQLFQDLKEVGVPDKVMKTTVKWPGKVFDLGNLMALLRPVKDGFEITGKSANSGQIRFQNSSIGSVCFHGAPREKVLELCRSFKVNPKVRK